MQPHPICSRLRSHLSDLVLISKTHAWVGQEVRISNRLELGPAPDLFSMDLISLRDTTRKNYKVQFRSLSKYWLLLNPLKTQVGSQCLSINIGGLPERRRQRSCREGHSLAHSKIYSVKVP